MNMVLPSATHFIHGATNDVPHCFWTGERTNGNDLPFSAESLANKWCLLYNAHVLPTANNYVHATVLCSGTKYSERLSLETVASSVVHMNIYMHCILHCVCLCIPLLPIQTQMMRLCRVHRAYIPKYKCWSQLVARKNITPISYKTKIERNMRMGKGVQIFRIVRVCVCPIHL